MPRVLRIINRLNLGGPTFNAAYLSKFLAPEFETLLLAGMIDETEASSDFITGDMGLHPVCIPEMFREIDFWKDRKAYRKIKKIIADFKPDIIHTHAAKAGALGRMAGYEMKVPVILHTFHGHVFHSYFSPLKTRMFLEIERYVAKKSTRIIAISERQKKELGLIYKVAPLDKIEVVPLGFDLNRFKENVEEKRKSFRKEYGIEDDEIVISIVGRLVPVKNHKLFLEAVQYLYKNCSDKVRVFIVGDGEEKENLLALSSALGIPHTWFPSAPAKKYLTFCSWRRDVDVVYAGSDIVALSSSNEGTPVSLIEAQAASRAIVTTRVGGIQDIVIPGVTALISPRNKMLPFADNLLKLVQDQVLRNELGKNGEAHVWDKFSYKRLVRDMRLLYNNLLSDKKTNPALANAESK